MTRIEIADGVFCTYLQGSFKKNRITVSFRSPLERSTITDTALIPSLLDLECRRYPSLTALRRKLNSLYGADLYCESTIMEQSRIVTASVEGVEESYIRGGEGLSVERAELLGDILFDPRCEGGGFPQQSVRFEAENLRERIESLINNKRGFCFRKLIELYYGDDPRSMPSVGFAEDIDGLDPVRIMDVHRAMLASAAVEIVNIGAEERGVADFMKKLFAGVKRAPRAVVLPDAVPISAPREKTYEFDVEQDKLAMVFSAGRRMSEQEQAISRVANEILGGLPTSRLFVNVREKESLCYYCSSTPGVSSGTLVIDSGVEAANADRLRSAIFAEIEKLVETPPSEKELSEAKLSLQNAFSAIGNSAESVSSWFLNSLYRLGRPVEPSEELERIMSVSSGDVSRLLSLMKLQATVRVTGGVQG